MNISGFIYRSYRIKNEAQNLADKNVIKILCLGDSFTFGIGAPKDYSYPEQLEKMLNADITDSRFIVYNAAIPGSNSSQLSKHFDEYIKKFSPDIIVVMIGCNNKDIPLDSNYYLFRNGGFRTYLYKLNIFLENNLRSYELLKMIIGKIKNNIKPNRVKETRVIFTLRKKPINTLEEYEALIKSGEDYFDKRDVALAQEAFQNAITLDPNDEKGHLGLAMVFIHALHQYELGIKELNKVLKINPENLKALDSLWMANYRLGRSKAAQEVIEKYVSLHPEDEMNLSYFLNRGLPDIKDEEAFDKLLSYDLENIVKSAERIGLKIILQGYPSFKGNRIIEDTASKLRVPFVNNKSVFEELISENGYDWKDSSYFAEDGHCNANGYGIMAKNLYKVIRSEIQKLQ